MLITGMRHTPLLAAAALMLPLLACGNEAKRTMLISAFGST